MNKNNKKKINLDPNHKPMVRNGAIASSQYVILIVQKITFILVWNSQRTIPNIISGTTAVSHITREYEEQN
jgi:hypothetical protein